MCLKPSLFLESNVDSQHNYFEKSNGPSSCLPLNKFKI